MFQQGLKQMNMVANSRRFPDISDPHDQTTVPLRNLLAHFAGEDKNIFIGPKAWTFANALMGAENATPKQREKALNFQKEAIHDEYVEFEDEMCSLDEAFMPAIFDIDIMEQVEWVYEAVFGKWNRVEKAKYFLCTSSSEFEEKMNEYNKTLKRHLKNKWLAHKRLYKATMSEDELNAYTQAEAKLSWVMQLRNQGYYANVPFPCKAFVKDSLERLQTPALGFQAVSLLLNICA